MIEQNKYYEISYICTGPSFEEDKVYYYYIRADTVEEAIDTFHAHTNSYCQYEHKINTVRDDLGIVVLSGFGHRYFIRDETQ